MKYKIERWEYWQRIVAPNSWFNFSTNSPVGCISGPHIAYAWAGADTINSDVCFTAGTIIGCRLDIKDPLPLNLDYWRLNCVGSLHILEIVDFDKSEIPEHWCSGLPTVFQRAPAPIKEVILNSQVKAVGSAIG